MEYVIDANVALKWFIPEPYSDKAEAILNGFRHHGLSLIAPDLIIPEVVQTLWKQSARSNEITLQDARESCTDFVALQLPVYPSATIAEHALNFATEENHPVYDALYIVLALEGGSALITADQTVVNKLSGKFPFIRSLGSL